MTGSAPRLEVVQGDLFDSLADILVVPCSTAGTMMQGVSRRVRELGVKLPSGGLEPGQVVKAGTTDVHKVRQTVLYAAVVPSGQATNAEIVEAAAREIGSYTSDAESLIAVPLLGTGAGELDPQVSLAAIRAGFLSTAAKGALVRVYVIEPSLFDALGQLPPAEPPDDAGLSSAVRNAVAELGSETTVTAAALTLQILEQHREYGGGTASDLRVVPDDAAHRQRPADWLADVRSLFDPVKAPELHGRLVIIGLSEIDEPLRKALDRTGFRDRLIGELRENLDDLRAAGAAREQTAPSAPARDENVPTHTDNPAVVDELGRQGFARVLARRIRDARSEEARNAFHVTGRKNERGGAFLVHLHAPWGAGKTSLLNFLTEALTRTEREQDRGYVVVTFNAWRHQRITPPWWWLMTTIYSEAVRKLPWWRGIWLRLREYHWRLKGGWPGYLALLVVAATVIVVWQTGILDGLGDKNVFSLDTASGLLVAAAAIAAPALTLWGLIRGFGRWVLASSAQGARRFVENTSDPMRVVHEHVRDLASWIKRDIVVMIDDLDRCKGPYVVELLEGIQTLFRDVPVTYVVAADRDWLSDSYATEYQAFKNVSAQPGKPVGYLFLEKTFQISVGLPTAGERIRPFWDRLLRSSTVPRAEELEQARARARDDLSGRKTADAGQAVHDDPGATTADVLARRETVAVEMVSERAREDHVHTLEPFRDLLGRDPNPRAMKRLVNAYGIARGCEILNGYNLEGDHEKEQLTALWTILDMRWPRLGNYLAVHPECVGSIGNGRLPAGVPKEIGPLFSDADVVAVVRGDATDVDAELDAAALQNLLRT